MNYALRMQEVAADRFDALYDGINELVFLDFPDYPNVGDSAIALGQLRYFANRGVRVKRAHSIATLKRSALEQSEVVMINGGGNIAGLYPVIDEHRYRVANELNPEALLIQAPQSVHFANDAAKSDFVSKFASRNRLRFAARDSRSFQKMASILPKLHLCPDAVHHLGAIEAPAPKSPVVVLARTDQESASQPLEGEPTQDWLRDDFSDRIAAGFRRRISELHGSLPWNLSTSAWQRKAENRLKRGLGILSTGETVVTDRLHAMLLALQMGRRVVAVDNSTAKLTGYYDTWLSDIDVPLTFARDLPTAVARARKDY